MKIERSTQIALAVLLVVAVAVSCNLNSGPTSQAGSTWVERRSRSTATSTTAESVRTTDSALRGLSTRRGGDYYVMPDLRGRQLQDSQDHLADLGVYLFAQRDATSANRYQVLDTNWKVCWTRPQAGKRVHVDTRVFLYSVKLDEACPRSRR